MKLVPLVLLLLLASVSLYQAHANETAVGDVDEVEVPETVLKVTFLMLISVLMVVFLIGYVLANNHVIYMSEAGAAMIIGALIGVAIRYGSDVARVSSLVSFNQEFFFLILLPPIIFESGYNMKSVCEFANQTDLTLRATFSTILTVLPPLHW